MSNLYIRFLRIARALETTNKSLKDIDATSIQILNEIAINHLDEKPMTVTHAMELRSIASPATIHRKLDELRKAGLIDLVFNGKNRRTKFIVPTKSALAYFDKMSGLMIKAVEY